MCRFAGHGESFVWLWRSYGNSTLSICWCSSMNPTKLACATADTCSSPTPLSVNSDAMRFTVIILSKSLNLNLSLWNFSGERMGRLLALFPIMYLSGGTCVALIIIGGSTSKIFFDILCAGTCSAQHLTPVQWYLVFTSAAVLLSQLPNLNSIAGVSLIGAITAVGYCTLIWVISVAKGRLPGVSYNPIRASSEIVRVFDLLNSLGIISFAFRGHNLILEIQVRYLSHNSTIRLRIFSLLRRETDLSHGFNFQINH